MSFISLRTIHKWSYSHRVTLPFVSDSPVAYSAFRDRTREVIDRIEVAGITVPAGSRFRRYLRELERACAIQTPHDANKVDPDVWHRALLEVEDLAFVAETLLDPPLRGVESRLQAVISGAVRPVDEQKKHSPARDIQFELVLAAIFCSAGLSVQLAEPDLIVELEGEEIGVAAKRPRSRQKLGRNLRQAEKQIGRAAMRGVIAVDLSCILNPTDGFIVASTFPVAKHQINSTIDQFVVVNRAAMEEEARPQHTFGLLAYFAAPVFDTSGPRLATMRRCSVAHFGMASRQAMQTVVQLYERIHTVLAG